MAMDFRKTPALMFTGDKRQGRKWIPYAKKELARWKKVTKTGWVNQMYRPVKGTKILVKSFDQNDYIHIHVEKLGLCEVKVRIIEQFDKSIKIGVKYNHRGTPGKDPFSFIVDWGEGDQTFHAGGSGDEKWAKYEYENEGNYTIKIKAFNAKGYPENFMPPVAKGYHKHGYNWGTQPAPGILGGDDHAYVWAKEWSETNFETLQNHYGAGHEGHHQFVNDGINRCEYYAGDRWPYSAWHQHMDLYRPYRGYNWVTHTVLLLSKTSIDFTNAGISGGKWVGIIGWRDYWSEPFKPGHGHGIYLNDELWKTVEQRPSSWYSSSYVGFRNRSAEITNISNITSIEHRDIGQEIAEETGTGIGYMRVVPNTFSVFVFPYDCMAIKQMDVKMPPDEPIME